MITEKMKKIVFLLKKDIDNSLKKYNLTTVQLLILMGLNQNRNKKVIQKDICELLELKHSTVIEILKKLEGKRYIHIEKNYRSYLSITDEGRKVLKKIGVKKGFVEDKLLDGFTEEEINKLSEQLDRMYKNIEGAKYEK